MNFEAVKLARSAHGISGMARALLFDLAIYANEAGVAQVSAQRLSEDLGTDLRWIRRILSEIVGCGYLEVAKKGNGRGQITAYRFVKNSGVKTMVSDPTETVVHRRKNSGQNHAKTMVCTPPTSKEVNEARDNARPRAGESSAIIHQDQDSGDAKRRWQEALECLQAALDPESFEAWFSGIVCYKLDSKQVVLVAPSDFIRRWIIHNYDEQIIKAAQIILGIGDDLELIVNVHERDWT